jgi:hypothetical protein
MNEFSYVFHGMMKARGWEMFSLKGHQVNSKVLIPLPPANTYYELYTQPTLELKNTYQCDFRKHLRAAIIESCKSPTISYRT